MPQQELPTGQELRRRGHAVVGARQQADEESKVDVGQATCRPRVVVVVVGGWCRVNDAAAVVAGGSTTALVSLAALSGGGAMTRTAPGMLGGRAVRWLM